MRITGQRKKKRKKKKKGSKEEKNASLCIVCEQHSYCGTDRRRVQVDGLQPFGRVALLQIFVKVFDDFELHAHDESCGCAFPAGNALDGEVTQEILQK